ncbi:hypothetical protein D3C76_952500 [compost metagenome]
MVQVQGDVAGVDRLSGVAYQYRFGQLLQDGVEEHGLAVHVGVPGTQQYFTQGLGTGSPPVGAAFGQGQAGQGSQQGLGGDVGVGHQRQFRRVVAYGLVGVDINAQQGTGDIEAAGEGHVVVGFGQLGANGQHHVGFANQFTSGHHRLGRTDQQRVGCR